MSASIHKKKVFSNSLLLVGVLGSILLNYFLLAFLDLNILSLSIMLILSGSVLFAFLSCGYAKLKYGRLVTYTKLESIIIALIMTIIMFLGFYCLMYSSAYISEDEKINFYFDGDHVSEFYLDDTPVDFNVFFNTTVFESSSKLSTKGTRSTPIVFKSVSYNLLSFIISVLEYFGVVVFTLLSFSSSKVYLNVLNEYKTLYIHAGKPELWDSFYSSATLEVNRQFQINSVQIDLIDIIIYEAKDQVVQNIGNPNLDDYTTMYAHHLKVQMEKALKSDPENQVRMKTVYESIMTLRNEIDELQKKSEIDKILLQYNIINSSDIHDFSKEEIREKHNFKSGNSGLNFKNKSDKIVGNSKLADLIETPNEIVLVNETDSSETIVSSLKVIYCRTCGKKLRMDSNFCMYCGLTVEEA